MKSLKWWQGQLRWMGDLATMKRRQSTSDHSYLTHNGKFYKLFDEFLKLRGNGGKFSIEVQKSEGFQA